jgi:hypothetical protein
MSKLYLFGNGFDIAHEIKTPYSAFRKFLKENHEDFLTSFEAMYHIQPLDDTEPWYTETAQKRWDLNVLKDLWKYFEEEMGMPDDSGMYDAALSLVDSMPDCGIKDTLDYHWRREYGFAADLQKYVLEWLETIDTSAAKCKKSTLMNANSDYFINFNYTDTLEKVYGIKNVLHIHGGVTSCCAISPIMGHGNKYIIDSNLRKAHDYLNEGIEWVASIHEAIARFCYSLYKDTDLIISQNEDFFSNLQSVDEIVTLGLSFGNVDIPYLDRILNAINPTTKWTVYYYSPEDKIRLKEVFGILGVTRKYEVYFLESKHFWDA